MEQTLMDFYKRRLEQEGRIVAHCRGLIPTLKDRGCPSAAEELAALYFTLDAIEGEAAAFVERDPAGTLAAVLEAVRRQRGAL
jgi:hypothetical protein